MTRFIGQQLHPWIQVSCQEWRASQVLERVCKHAHESNWKNRILVLDSMGAVKNLLIEYGKLTTEDVLPHADTYIGQGVHKDQNNVQMFTCLSHSLTEEAKEGSNFYCPAIGLVPKTLQMGVVP